MNLWSDFQDILSGERKMEKKMRMYTSTHRHIHITHLIHLYRLRVTVKRNNKTHILLFWQKETGRTTQILTKVDSYTDEWEYSRKNKKGMGFLSMPFYSAFTFKLQ
jgi:hypothetical protein